MKKSKFNYLNNNIIQTRRFNKREEYCLFYNKLYKNTCLSYSYLIVSDFNICVNKISKKIYHKKISNHK